MCLLKLKIRNQKIKQSFIQLTTDTKSMDAAVTSAVDWAEDRIKENVDIHKESWVWTHESD